MDSLIKEFGCMFLRNFQMLWFLMAAYKSFRQRQWQINKQEIIIINKKVERMDFSKLQCKKIYEFILSSTESSGDLKNALQSIVRRAIEESCHFQFLLHRINWFSHPFAGYLDQLQRVIRLYRGKGKEAAKVAYNLLIQNLSLQSSNKLAIQSLKSLVKDAFHQDIIIQCLKQNYPHKLCPISMHQAYLDSLILFCKAFPKHRFEILEIIIENLVYFDTQLLIGDSYSNRHFPQDEKIKLLRGNALNENAQKYDILLSKVLEYIQKEQKSEELLKSVFQIFQTKILPIKSTKLIQYIVFYLAESTKKMSSNFSSLLLANILDTDMDKQNWYRIFTQSNFFLVSYIIRSNAISINKITQIVNILITYLSEKLIEIEEKEVTEKLKLKETFFKNERNLHILQTILAICAYEPVVKAKLDQKYENLIKQAQRKIHFKYFIHEDLLSNLGLMNSEALHKEGTYKITLKFSNKFNPVILPKVGTIIDPLFRWRNQNNKCDKQGQGKKNMKRDRDEITFCEASDTGPSHTASQKQNKLII